VQVLKKYTEGAVINTLVAETDLPVHRLSAVLFELELRDIVRPLAGSIYKLKR
jgi:DNA processing protein